MASFIPNSGEQIIQKKAAKVKVKKTTKQSKPNLPQVSVWLVPWNPDSTASFVNNAAKITDAMPEWFGVDENGNVFERELWSADDWKKVQTAASNHKVNLYAMVSNYANSIGFSADRMTKMLATPTSRNKAIQDLIAGIQKSKFTGIDLDLESLAETDRNNYSAFVTELSTAFHKRGLKVSVTVHPKTSEDANWSGPAAQDWKVLGKAADIFRIMCYDFSWSGSKPGPIAPTDWVATVAKYAISVVPKQKVDIGVAWYGYRWKSQGPADSLVWKDLNRLPMRLDVRSGEIKQGENVHFSGAAAFQQKLAAIQPLGISRFSAWYGGSEDPTVWQYIPNK